MIRLLMPNLLVGVLQLGIDLRLIVFHLNQVITMMFLDRLYETTS